MLGLIGVGCYDVVIESYLVWFRGLRMFLIFVVVSSFILIFFCKLRLKFIDFLKDFDIVVVKE